MEFRRYSPAELPAQPGRSGGPDAVASPCVRVCAIDAASGYCRGCFRTLGEISYWTTYTVAEQQALLAEIERRRLAAPR